MPVSVVGVRKRDESKVQAVTEAGIATVHLILPFYLPVLLMHMGQGE